MGLRYMTTVKELMSKSKDFQIKLSLYLKVTCYQVKSKLVEGRYMLFGDFLVLM